MSIWEGRLDARTPAALLIAGDNLDTRDILSVFPARRGYETIIASDGEEALALAVKLPFDLALLDVVMPGPSGMELAARMQGAFSDVVGDVW